MMGAQGRRGRGTLVVAILCALLVTPGQGHAQSDSPADSRPAAVWIRAEEVPIRAGALLRQLEEAQPDPAVQSTVERIEKGLAQLDPDIDAGLRSARAAVAHATPFLELEELRRRLVADASPLGAWQDALAAEAKRVLEVLDQIAQERAVWSATRDQPEISAAGEVVGRRVQGSLEALDATAANLLPWRTRVLTLSDRLVDRDAAVDQALEQLAAATHTERANLLVPGRAPLWQTDFVSRLRSEWPRVPEELRSYARGTYAYVRRDERPLVVQLVLVVLLMVAFGRLTAPPLARPYSLALLLALLATPMFHPLAPQRFRQLLGFAALVPAARVLLPAIGGDNLIGFVGLFALFLVDRVTMALAPLPAVACVGFLLTLALGLGLALWFRRRVGRTGSTPRLHRAMSLAAFGLGVAILAQLWGWVNLALLLGRGVLVGMSLTVLIYAGVVGLEPVLVYALSSATLRRSHLFERRTALVRQRVKGWLHWLGAALGFYLWLRAVGLQGTAIEELHALLQAGISVGTLSLSVGAVLAFVTTLLMAQLLVRVIAGVLEEDVYPRTNLPRGVPFVLSALVRYAVYSFGFLLALAAAGVQLTQLTILLGGLSVGIGLGLQDLVKNFAAGLTLLLERRVHVGDALQIPSQDIFGRVLSIGLRATMVRSWNGSEVVVPNADLVSGAITNWTLSDRLCRIEVPVGVAYGTDPDRVVTVLLDVVRSLDRLLADPAPQALFKGFGESSLDFLVRAWTDEGYEQTAVLTSELALAMHRGLSAAAITIPFPQREVHLASVSPEVRAAFSRLEPQE